MLADGNNQFADRPRASCKRQSRSPVGDVMDVSKNAVAKGRFRWRDQLPESDAGFHYHRGPYDIYASAKASHGGSGWQYLEHRLGRRLAPQTGRRALLRKRDVVAG